MIKKPSLLVVTGPTASGKTKKGVAICRALDGEIISGDSRQVYRGMDLGTGKDLEDYDGIPYHLIDIVPAGEKYNLHRFLRDANAAREDILSRGKLPVLCGGTGLYIESVINGLALPDVPENRELRSELEERTLEELTAILAKMKHLHNKTDVDSKKRAISAIEIEHFYHEHPEEAVTTKPHPVEDAVIIGVDIPREERRRLISERLEKRVDSGIVEEIRTLLDSGIPPEDLIYYGLEYKFVTQYVIGQISRAQMLADLETAIHQFAKRQMTWFRGMERRGFKINWIPLNRTDEEFVAETIRLLQH